MTIEPKPGDKGDPSLQVHAYRYEATLDGPAAELDGSTHFLAVSHEDPRLDVGIGGLGETIPGGDNQIVLLLKNRTGRSGRIEARMLVGESDAELRSFQQVFVLPAETVKPFRIEVPYQIGEVGPNRMKIMIQNASRGTRADDSDGSPHAVLFAAETTFHVPQLYAADYGFQLPASSDEVGIWWCQSGWKVSAQRPVPKASRPAIVVEAAVNETDAAQLVLRPVRSIANLSVRVTTLQGPANAIIQSDHVDVLRVRYVHVARATDATGTTGLWPDPLPPIQGTLLHTFYRPSGHGNASLAVADMEA